MSENALIESPQESSNWLGWLGGVGGLSAVVGLVVGWLSKGLRRASAEGEAAGELRQWKQIQESTLRSLESRIDASEIRAMARIAALELRREAIELKLASLPTRDEMDARFDRFDVKFDKLDVYIHNKS